jgi:hypothetical protein
MATGNFVWYDLLTSDVSASTAFYGALFGWDIHDNERHPGYPMIHVEGNAIGGVEARAGEPSRWLAYVSVDDLEGTLAQVTARGGTAGGIHPIPGVGRIATASDPQGATLALLAFDNPAGGNWAPPKGKNALTWAELQTSDDVAARDFWCGLFGWPHQAWEMGGGTYWLVGNQHNAGIMRSPMPGPSYWMLYANVEDADAIVARTRELGGRLIVGPSAMGNIGRFAVLADPQGAVFAVMQSYRR